jgi:hypothetical protein
MAMRNHASRNLVELVCLSSLMAEHEMYFFAENSETSLEDCNSGSVTQDDDGEGGSWDLVEGKGHELFQQEAELQYQAELEAEELKLAEGLELQRCVEEEAKEQHGDEQHCKNLAQQSSMVTPEPFNPEHLETQMDGCLHLPEPKTLVDSSPSVDTLTDESTISSIVLQPSYFGAGVLEALAIVTPFEVRISAVSLHPPLLLQSVCRVLGFQSHNSNSIFFFASESLLHRPLCCSCRTRNVQENLGFFPLCVCV